MQQLNHLNTDGEVFDDGELDAGEDDEDVHLLTTMVTVVVVEDVVMVVVSLTLDEVVDVIVASGIVVAAAAVVDDQYGKADELVNDVNEDEIGRTKGLVNPHVMK